MTLSTPHRSVSVCMVGTGEYTTGYIESLNGASRSDKKKGVVLLVMLDLQRRYGVHSINRIVLAGTNGTKFPSIRRHLQESIYDCYRGIPTSVDSIETYPKDDVENDPHAYKQAIDSLLPGDLVTIFTPDNTHFAIAEYAIKKGMHCLVTKPCVKTVKEHNRLITLARKFNVLVQIEVHKRFDPMYSDARQRIVSSLTTGGFEYFYSYMSQPQFQLETFRKWIDSKASDISYYLNSHHVDFHCWCMHESGYVPNRVMATASSQETTITLNCEWMKHAQNSDGCSKRGIAVYTASWSGPNGSEVHTQQRFMYHGLMPKSGEAFEIKCDQAHRGYEYTDSNKYSSLNPLYMKYTPHATTGHFNGQNGYGYQSIEDFVAGAVLVNETCGTKAAMLEELAKQQSRPTIFSTIHVTAILEAGRRSLDNNSQWILIKDLLSEM